MIDFRKRERTDFTQSHLAHLICRREQSEFIYTCVHSQGSYASVLLLFRWERIIACSPCVFPVLAWKQCRLGYYERAKITRRNVGWRPGGEIL